MKFFCDDHGVPFVLPCIFSHALFRNKENFVLKYTDDGNRRVKAAELKKQHISKSEVSSIINELKNFLVWVEGFCSEKETMSIENHHNFPADLLNYYINNVLIRNQSKSLKMAEKALTSLRSYYNFLTYHGFTNRKDLKITNESKAIARENTNHRGVVKYFSPDLRAQIYANARCLRDECILRAGGTTGVRAKENIGFVLNDFMIGQKKYRGLLSLFRQLALNPEQTKFEFLLQGKYAKARSGAGGKSRMLYIPRETLIRFKEYYENERPECDIDSLFVTEPSSGHLKAISPARVHAAFRYVKTQIILKQNQGLLADYIDVLEEKHSYHILRHSFGTDTFYDAVQSNGMRVDDVTPTSQPYLVTAALLGHEASSRGAPATTKDYIRSCHLKMTFCAH